MKTKFQFTIFLILIVGLLGGLIGGEALGGSWKWSHPYPTNYDINDIWTSATGEMVAVGEEGTILFHDWLMNKGDSEGFRFIYAFPPLETFDSYSDKLSRAGFEIVSAQLRTEAFHAHVFNLRNNVSTQKRRLIDTCGRELYDNWNVVSLYTLRMIEEEKLTSGLFIARKK